MDFDKKLLARTIYDEAKAAFSKIIAEQKQNNIYSLSLYNSGDDWCYLYPTVSTESGLEAVAQQYKENEYYKNQSLNALKQDLRWSPCDSPLHDEYCDEMPNTQALLTPVSDLMYELYKADNIEASDEIHDYLVQLCLDTLNQLQNDGVFGILDRAAFTLNLINGDQSDEERLERAKMLNPPHVYEKYKLQL